MVLLQVALGLPLFLLPCGFHVRVCFVIDLFFLLSVWSIHFHFLLLIWVSISSCLVSSHAQEDLVSKNEVIKSCSEVLNHLLHKCNVFLMSIFFFGLLQKFGEMEQFLLYITIKK